VTDALSLDQEIDIIADCLREELLSEAAPVDEARTYLSSLAPDGHWPDVDYADASRTHWSPAQHTARMALLARAYHRPGTPLSGSEGVARAVTSTLAFWVEHDPQSDNWWFNCINTPRYLGQVLLLMGGAISPSDRDRAVAIVRRSSFQRTGANLTWEAGNLLVLACAIRGDALALALADPTQVLDRVCLRLSGPYHGPGCAYDAQADITRVTLDLPSGAYAGQTVLPTLTTV
jgi:hypothetical protein